MCEGKRGGEGEGEVEDAGVSVEGGGGWRRKRRGIKTPEGREPAINPSEQARGFLAR